MICFVKTNSFGHNKSNFDCSYSTTLDNAQINSRLQLKQAAFMQIHLLPWSY